MELIDKKPLLRSLVDWQMSNFTEVGHEREYNLLDSIIKGIENAPTVEAKEVVHGEWITENGVLFPVYRCSECNCATALGKTKFCPNCGCMMEK